MIEIGPNLALEIDAEDFDRIVAAQESPRPPTPAIIEATRRWHALLAKQKAAASLDDPTFSERETR